MSFLPYDAVLSLINNPQENDDLRKMMNWFKHHVPHLSGITDCDLKIMLSGSTLKQYKPEQLIVKQGEEVDNMLILLKGHVSVYKTDANFTELETVQPNTPYINPKKKLRQQLGNFIGKHDAGFTSGHISLTRSQSWSVASLVTDDVCGVMFVSRSVYDVVLKVKLENEIEEKLNFYKNCGHFNNYPPEKSGQMMIALKKQVYTFGNVIHEQNSAVTDVMFISTGEVRIVLKTLSSMKKSKFNFIDENPLFKSKGLETREKAITNTPKTIHLDVVLLKQNETLGLTEFLTNGLTHPVSAVCNSNNTIIYSLSINQFIEFIPSGSQLMKEFLNTTICRYQNIIPLYKNQTSIEFFYKQLADLLRISSQVRLKDFFEINEEHQNDNLTTKRGNRTLNDFYKEFIPEHGFLINQDGPGTVFHWLRMNANKIKLKKFKEQQRLDIDNGSKIKVLTNITTNKKVTKKF